MLFWKKKEPAKPQQPSGPPPRPTRMKPFYLYGRPAESWLVNDMADRFYQDAVKRWQDEVYNVVLTQNEQGTWLLCQGGVWRNLTQENKEVVDRFMLLIEVVRYKQPHNERTMR